MILTRFIIHLKKPFLQELHRYSLQAEDLSKERKSADEHAKGLFNMLSENSAKHRETEVVSSIN